MLNVLAAATFALVLTDHATDSRAIIDYDLSNSDCMASRELLTLVPMQSDISVMCLDESFLSDYASPASLRKPARR